MIRKFLSFALLLFAAQAALSQTPEIKIEARSETKSETKTETEISAELKKQAIEFLRESAGEVGNLRTLENRISFASEMAGLMWFHEEKEARQMMNAVVGDFRQLLAQYDAQLTASGIEIGEGDEHSYGGGLSGAGGADQTDKARLMRKLTKAMAVRQQVTLSIAEHDAQAAMDFYAGSLQTFSNPEIRKRFEAQDSYFESRLLNQIAERDAGKALEFGRKSLTKGVNYNHIELLKKIYEKDAGKGAIFAEEIAGKLKDKDGDADNFHMLAAVFKLGVDNYEKTEKDNAKPMLGEQNLRELADLTAQGMLKRIDSPELMGYDLLSSIEKYAPSRAVQIRVKTNAKASSSPRVFVEEAGVTASAEELAAAAKHAGEKNEQEALMKDLQNLDAKQLPKERREKIVAQARKIIAAVPNRQQKIAALTALAAQIAKLGDKELAAEIFKDAHGLISAAPKTYLDFIEVWMLSSALAQTDAEKAFPLLEDTILRLNEIVAAFVKVGEFMDTTGEMIDDGEVQIGSFGGSMIKEITRDLGAAEANAALLGLAKSDFTKTKGLTNRFDRLETRILAKMLVLRAVLGDKKKAAEE